MSMEVKRIGDLVKSGAIQVFHKDKGFTIRDLTDGYMKDSDDGSTTDSVFGFGGHGRESFSLVTESESRLRP